MKSILLASLLFTNFCFSQTREDFIFFSTSDRDSCENNLYKKAYRSFNYKTQYTNLKNADIPSDVESAVARNDLRLMAIYGVSILFPGLEKEQNRDAYVKKSGFKVIMGTSDVVNISGPPLQHVAYEYAKAYNKLLLRKIVLTKK